MVLTGKVVGLIGDNARSPRGTTLSSVALFAIFTFKISVVRTGKKFIDTTQIPVESAIARMHGEPDNKLPSRPPSRPLRKLRSPAPLDPPPPPLLDPEEDEVEDEEELEEDEDEELELEDEDDDDEDEDEEDDEDEEVEELEELVEELELDELASEDEVLEDEE